MATPPKWSLVLTNLQGTVIGEIIGASSVTFTSPLNRLPTLNFQIPLWHYLAPSILTTATMVKAYRQDPDGGTNRLVYVGITLGAEEQGDSINQTIAVSTVGPFWRLTKRLLGVTKAGVSFNNGVVDGVPQSKSLGQIAHDVLTTANGRGYTGIQSNTDVSGTVGVLINPGLPYMAQGSVGPYWLKPASEAIAELSAGLNSFDYAVYPTEPTNVGKAWPQIGYLHVQDMIGTAKPNAIFEYGTPRANVTSYNRSLTRDSYLNRAVVPVAGWPDGASLDLRIREDQAYIDPVTYPSTAVGLYEEAVNDAGVVDNGLRDNIADEHLKYRKTPKQIVTFTVTRNSSPTPYRDFIVGDYVRGRAEVRGIVRFDSMFRIWGATFSLDQNGNESLDLQLVQE